MIYIDTIKNDLSRARFCDSGEDLETFPNHERLRSSEDDSSSGRRSGSGQSEEVLDEFERTNDKQDYLSIDNFFCQSTTVENNEIKVLGDEEGCGEKVKIVSGVELENPRSFSKNFSESFPPIIVNKLETTSAQSTADEVNESCVISEEFIVTSSNTTGESRLFVDKEKENVANLAHSSNNVGIRAYDDVCDDVMSDDVVFDELMVGKATDDDAHTYESDISSLENHALDTKPKEKPLIIVTNIDDTTEITQKEAPDTEEDLEDETKHCRCFDKSENQIAMEDKIRNLCFQEQTNLNDVERNNTDSTQNHDTAYNSRNLPNTGQNSSESVRVDGENFEWENSSFLLKTPAPVLNRIEQDIDIDRTINVQMNESNSDENASLETKEFVVDTLDVMLQNKVKSNVGHNSESQEITNPGTMVNTNTLHPDTEHSIVEDQTSTISDEKSGSYNSLDKPLTERTFSQSSIASSDISVDGKSNFADEERSEILENEVCLASKAGMDKFKEFLINTKGEALLLLWLQVETWKHLGNEGNKIRSVSVLLQTGVLKKS